MNVATATVTAPGELVLPENASLFTRLRLAIKALNILKNDPTHLVAGPLVNACLDTEVYRSLIARLQQTEEGRRLLSERPSLQGPDLDLSALETLPEGTLGAAFARYFRSNGISPFETTFEIRNDIDFISKRYRETHDLYHVLTGYHTDVAGEMEVQAFAMGNLGIRSAWVIITFGTLELLLRQRPKDFRLGGYLRRLRAAHQRGANARFFLAFAFEKHWETPVASLQQELLPQQRAPAH